MAVIIFLHITPMVRSQETGDDLLAWWTFDELRSRRVIDFVTQIEDTLEDNFRYVQGVTGSALKFDGFTSSLVR